MLTLMIEVLLKLEYFPYGLLFSRRLFYSSSGTQTSLFGYIPGTFRAYRVTCGVSRCATGSSLDYSTSRMLERLSSAPSLSPRDHVRSTV
jgi:hypothetical protein